MKCPTEYETKVIERYQSGMSICKIADMDFVKRSAINHIVRKFDVSRPGKKLGADFTNQRFGRLTAISRSHPYKNGEFYWMCRCDCGVVKPIRLSTLRDGEAVSCGMPGHYHRLDGEAKKPKGPTQFSQTEEHALACDEIVPIGNGQPDTSKTPSLSQETIE
jgi:hypothetical protein